MGARNGSYSLFSKKHDWRKQLENNRKRATNAQKTTRQGEGQSHGCRTAPPATSQEGGRRRRLAADPLEHMARWQTRGRTGIKGEPDQRIRRLAKLIMKWYMQKRSLGQSCAIPLGEEPMTGVARGGGEGLGGRHWRHHLRRRTAVRNALWGRNCTERGAGGRPGTLRGDPCGPGFGI